MCMAPDHDPIDLNKALETRPPPSEFLPLEEIKKDLAERVAKHLAKISNYKAAFEKKEGAPAELKERVEMLEKFFEAFERLGRTVYMQYYAPMYRPAVTMGEIRRVFDTIEAALSSDDIDAQHTAVRHFKRLDRMLEEMTALWKATGLMEGETQHFNMELRAVVDATAKELKGFAKKGGKKFEAGSDF